MIVCGPGLSHFVFRHTAIVGVVITIVIIVVIGVGIIMIRMLK